MTQRIRLRTAVRIALTTVFAAGLLGLSAAGASASPSSGQSSRAGTQLVVNYVIFVHTANIQYADTDATVKMKVYGTTNSSPGYVNLDNEADNFEQNSNDYFGPFAWFDIGRPDFIGVFKDSNGSEWYAEYAEVWSEITQQWYYCPMNYYFGNGAETQWFDCP